MPEDHVEREATRDELLALAHPLRLRILERLREGPSTASRLARDLGESSGATSYHLRALARVGVIEEDAERGRGRERWWRRNVPLLVIPTESEDPEGRAAEARIWSMMTDRDARVLRHFVASEPHLDREWRGAAFIGSWNLYLTPEEADSLGRRVLGLVDEVWRAADDVPPDARRCLVSFRALPVLEEQLEPE
jgi:DNA-binding transcriptional ArsR family regulator